MISIRRTGDGFHPGLFSQALAKSFADIDSFKEQVRIWTIKRNSECRKINCQFTAQNHPDYSTAQDARTKLVRLYPTVL